HRQDRLRDERQTRQRLRSEALRHQGKFRSAGELDADRAVNRRICGRPIKHRGCRAILRTPWSGESSDPNLGVLLMPLITVRTLEGLLTPAQKKAMIERVTDAALSVEGDAFRPVTWVLI